MNYPKEILNQHIAVLGKTRSGKTNSAKLLIEQVAVAGSRVCVIDPIKADYWGLTSSSDGNKAGLPFHIIGGKHGHVPLHAGAGAAIAEVVATGALKLSIIDMEYFGPRESGPFFAAFMETIFRKIDGVLYIVIDEAHLFAPKEGHGGTESMATYWFKRMASGSGSKGVRLVVSTQRVQELHNTVLSNCETVIAHRVTFPEDQKRISDWVASHASKDVLAEVKRSLPNLKRGEAWICSGEANVFERRQMPLCSTYDNSRTPSESDHQQDVKTAQIDQDALRSIIGNAVAEAEANDPKKLKAEIAALKLAAKKQQTPAAPAVDVEAIVAKAKAEARGAFAPIVKSMRDMHEWNKGRIDAVRSLLKHLESDGDSLAAQLSSLQTLMEAPPKVVVPRTFFLNEQHTLPVKKKATASTPPPEGLQPRHVRILAAIAWFEEVAGVDAPTREQIGARIGVNSNGGSFRNDLGALRTQGLVEYPTDGVVKRSESGKAVQVALPGGDCWDSLPNMLDPRHMRIMEVLRNRGRCSRADIGEAIGVDPAGGSFRNDLGRLRTLCLVQYPAPGEVELAEWLTGDAA